LLEKAKSWFRLWFAKFIKHHITAWLFPDGDEAETP